MISRRSLFTGSAALLAAPSIVRVASLMPLSVLPRCLITEVGQGVATMLEDAAWAARYLEEMSRALSDLIVFGRCVVSVEVGGCIVSVPLVALNEPNSYASLAAALPD